MNLLEYLRSKTQVDLDTFDIEVEAARELRGCIDCTSNQYEYYTELSKDNRKDILQKALELAAKWHDNFSSIRMEELAVEAAIIATGKRESYTFTSRGYLIREFIDAGYHELFTIIDETFDRSRVVMKVPATWEGLQACRELRDHEIKTLATTLFTMEQVVLAGEVGCVSISPFLHELKALFDQSYHDENPLLELCVKAQKWYEQNSLPTRVKACANIGLDEILQLAGVAAFTVVPDDLRLLASTRKTDEESVNVSLFAEQSQEGSKIEYPSYIDEEEKYRCDFACVDEGMAQLKLAQAIQIFCDFQSKAEAIVRAAKERDA
ncbi:aldolase [Aspergillus steynii IBT 23096]|uniref:Transaldolase n=1 Tax=Aspergillus steynii IBT 23096 TaxID=1392250 RepID=A0A2I2GMA7_9EURO|nr:aldolase [Aspergillus steynii IBT 23096]PLB54018.1 aldolase [Aspergillus steynii IBT 23096]